MGNPLAECLRACDLLGQKMEILQRSSWYKTAPWPPSDQPWYVNGVIEVAFAGESEQLMALLLRIEKQMGRERPYPNAPRIIDLDLIDFNGIATDDPFLTLPHPRMHQRAFVLRPLQEIAPAWRHPITGLRIEEMLKAVPMAQTTIPCHAS